MELQKVMLWLRKNIESKLNSWKLTVHIKDIMKKNTALI
ncbi:hypothetical protein ACVWYN_002881 [Pedobacter sp. UYP24]